MTSSQKLLRVATLLGFALVDLKRAINIRMGLTAENDKLPKAMLRPFPDGGSAGYVPDIEGMLFAYYEARGWDLATGQPTPGKLMDLGLEDVARYLWQEPGEDIASLHDFGLLNRK